MDKAQFARIQLLIRRIEKLLRDAHFSDTPGKKSKPDANKAIQAKTERTPDVRGATPIMEALAIRAEPTDSNKTCGEENEGIPTNLESKRDRREWILLWVEVFLLFAAVFTSIVTARQATLMKDTLAEMANQTPGILEAGTAAKDSVKVARDTLTKAVKDGEDSQSNFEKTMEQSKKALEETIETARMDQRAWVGHGSMALPECLDEGGRRVYISVGCNPRFGVNLSNFGRTPAVNVEVLVAASKRPSTWKWIDPPYDNRVGVFSNSALFPGPGGTNYSGPFSWPMSQMDVDGVKSGAVMVYFYGRIKYSDAFRRAHQTTFCVFVSRDLSSLESCPFYNTAN
jgi:hypothetical protein